MGESYFEPHSIDEVIAGMRGSLLVITPLYPVPENPYLCAFVHSRMQAYQAAGLSVDVVSQAFDGVSGTYEFEGVTVNRLNMNDLQTLLRRRHYDTIAVHFVENEYARVLESCDLAGSRLLLWCHGGESLYWDRPLFTTPYFSEERVMGNDELADLHARDAMLKRFNERDNVTFVFVSDFVKRRGEELLGIAWRNGVVIPNPIDFETFSREEKDPALRKRVFCAKTQDNASNYAVDTVVRTILALSRRACFADMEFTLVGTGSVHEQLVAPLRAFPNVRIVDRFLTHDELAAEHKRHGIALFPTRFDAQGVSMCEAAASGLAVISSERQSVADFLADDVGLLASVDDFFAYADIVERLYDDPDYFARCCEASYAKVARTCAPEITVEREIALLRGELDEVPGLSAAARVTYEKPAAPVLTIAVLDADEAAISALCHTVAECAGGQVEVIAVSSAAEAARRAQGAYVKLLGCRDFFELANIAAFVSYLEQAGEQVVLSDYLELAARTELPTRRGGQCSIMVPGQRYEHEDLDLAVEGYGFTDGFPSERACTLRRDLLASLLEVSADDAGFDALLARACELATDMSYYPKPVWHIRLEEEALADDEGQGEESSPAQQQGRVHRLFARLRR